MQLLRARAFYYCTGHTVMNDLEYDRLESCVDIFEKENPKFKHPNSPVGLVGSSNIPSYPRGIQREVCEFLDKKKLPRYYFERPVTTINVKEN